ncbi:MAG TPA: ABC transporter permease [Bryobacteraceae bacterium]|nr:ABC transporter permease [Bryobacteraceae bacterium]
MTGIPIGYNLRNLAVRKTTTLMTALGIALTVAVMLAVLALVEGLGQAFKSSGDPLHVLVMRRGAQSELTSNFTRERFNEVKFAPGIARSSSGEPMASLECVTVVVLDSPEQPMGANINLRGLMPVGIEMRQALKLEAGRWFSPGKREVVVGTGVAQRFPGARLGSVLEFGRSKWEVVGVMSHGNSAVNSEIWADLNQVAADFERQEVLSSALLRAVDEAGVQALINTLRADQRLQVDAQTEKNYYDAQTTSALPVQFIGTFVAVIMAVGSCFAAMNTMYAAVARRAREIGTLRVLGFSKGGILFSFFLESMLLSTLGGVMGVLLVLPLNNVTTAIGSFTTFTEVAFQIRITPPIMATGVLFGLIMGALGGIFPAASAARKEILTALREF